MGYAPQPQIVPYGAPGGPPTMQQPYSAPRRPQNGIVSRALAQPTLATVVGASGLVRSRSLRRGYTATKAHKPKVDPLSAGTKLDGMVQKVQEKLTLCCGPLLRPLKPYMESYDIYRYPVDVFPMIALAAIIVMCIWWLVKGNTWLRDTFTFYLDIGLLVSALFLHANPDLFITNVRLQYQVERFRFNNATFKNLLELQEQKLQGLKASAGAIDCLNNRFQGSFEAAQSQLHNMEASAKDNFFRYAKRCVGLYSDMNMDGSISPGEELNDAMLTSRCLFSGICPDFKQREELLMSTFSLHSEGVKVIDFSEIISRAIQPSMPLHSVQNMAKGVLRGETRG